MKYLIWIAGLRGPEPQLCHEKPVDGTGKPKPNLAIYEIGDNDIHMNLNQLAEKYPAPDTEVKS